MILLRKPRLKLRKKSSDSVTPGGYKNAIPLGFLIMKYLILLLFTIFLLGTHPNIPEDNNLYSAQLKTITVTADMLEGYVPKRAKSRREFYEINRPLFKYIAKHTWLTESQVASFLVIEQGLGSELFTKHNNPFNIKGKGISYKTWEYTLNNKVTASFKSYKTIREGVSDFIRLINTKYDSEPLSNSQHAKHLYDKGYFTDVNYGIRAVLANQYEKLNV